MLPAPPAPFHTRLWKREADETLIGEDVVVAEVVVYVAEPHEHLLRQNIRVPAVTHVGSQARVDGPSRGGPPGFQPPLFRRPATLLCPGLGPALGGQRRLGLLHLGQSAEEILPALGPQALKVLQLGLLDCKRGPLSAQWVPVVGGRAKQGVGVRRGPNSFTRSMSKGTG